MQGFLFYSNRCPFCKNLMIVMNNQKLLQLFQLICIDELNTIELLKRGIKQIPTLVIIEQNGKNNQKQIFEGENAGKWVENIITNRRMIMMQNIEKNRNAIQLQNNKSQHTDGMTNYYINEMVGISDSYSYWNDDLRKEVDIPQPKEFIAPSQLDSNRIITFQESNNKITNKEMSNKSMEYDRLRNNDINDLKKMFERQQIEAVISKRNIN